MARDPDKTEVAEQAISDVADLLADADSTPEGIVTVFDEDLLVQTNHGFQMDASRLWVQVEGTNEIDDYQLQNGGFRLSIPFEQAMRWMRTLDLVLLVLWDTAEQVGWYALPAEQVDPIKGVNSGQSSVTIRFAENDILSKEAVNTLIWRSRLEHHRLLALSSRDAQAVSEERKRKGTKKRGQPQPHARVLTAMDFTDLLGITERRRESGGMKYQIRDEIWQEFEEINNVMPDPNEGWRHRRKKIAYEVVERRWEMIEPKLDLPSVLIEDGAAVIISRMQQVADTDEEVMEVVTAWQMHRQKS